MRNNVNKYKILLRNIFMKYKIHLIFYSLYCMYNCNILCVFAFYVLYFYLYIQIEISSPATEILGYLLLPLYPAAGKDIWGAKML